MNTDTPTPETEDDLAGAIGGFIEELKRERDAARARVAELEQKIEDMGQQILGFESTFTIWQQDTGNLATEFPGVDWHNASSFIPCVQVLKARVAELESQNERHQTTIFKARDILQCGHVDNVVGALQTLCTRYNDTQARIATLEAAQNQTPLDRPDRPGLWWRWGSWLQPEKWICEDLTSLDITWYKCQQRGQWLPATPPPVPGKEKQP